MSLYSVARGIYAAIQDDCHAIELIRAERKSLAVSLATDPNASITVTSGTMNGQTFAAVAGMKPAQRLQVLSAICRMADEQTAISSTVQPLL